jgi:uncharacterized membrane protein YeaQ/YmgE (transglycosylase-associated protein family)
MADSFASFVTLLVIAVAVSAALHYGLKFYATSGLSSFLTKIVVAYIGAGLGKPLFGAWCENVTYAGVYIIPATLGALALLVLAVDLAKTLTRR